MFNIDVWGLCSMKRLLLRLVGWLIGFAVIGASLFAMQRLVRASGGRDAKRNHGNTQPISANTIGRSMVLNKAETIGRNTEHR